MKSVVSWVKRMVYREAEFQTDGEPTVTFLANEVASMCRMDNIKLNAKASPNFSSRSLSSIAPSQDLVMLRDAIVRRS